MRKIAIIMAACLSMAVTAMAQTSTKLTLSKANDYGLAYSLPNTVLDITIETQFTDKQPGEFYNYARRYLNIDNAITAPERKATVKSITIVPRGEANPENEWLLQFKVGQNVFVMLNEAGVPVAINTEKLPQEAKKAIPVAKPAAPTALETSAAQQAVTQEMTMSTSVSKRASLAAERIFELRDNRNDLISGQAENTPPDGQAMKLALDNLSAQEAALTAMFVGTEKTWTEVTTLVYTPGDEDVADFVLARLSPTAGIVDADDLSGMPITMSMTVLSNGEAPVDEKGQPKPFPKNGVAYCIPGAAQFSFSFNGVEIAADQFPIAQLGFNYGIDPKFFTDKKMPAYVIFDPTTGGIVKFGTLE